MWNQPSLEQLMKMPRLYETEHVPLQEKVIYEHFFLGGCDWYMAEFSTERRLFFGYARLLPGCGEWGYTSLNELEGIRVNGMEVDRDRFWVPMPFGEIRQRHDR